MPAYRSQFDGRRRLAAAVLVQAVKDAESHENYCERAAARRFLQSAMRPWAEMLDLSEWQYALLRKKGAP